MGPSQVLRARCEAGHGPPRHGALGAGAAAAGRGAGGDRPARLPVLLPHRRRRGRPHQELEGSGGGARLGCRQPGHLPARHLRRRPDPLRPADGALPLPAAPPAARHRHRRGVRAAHGGLRRGHRPLRRRPGQLHLDDGHLPGAARHPRRRRRARPAAGRDRRRRQGLSAHPGQPGARRAQGPAGAAGQPAGLEARRRHRRSRPALRPRRPARRAAPAHRAAPVRRAALRRHAARPHAGGEQLPRLSDEPVRQGRRRGARAAQARPAGHPDAVGDRARPRRGGAGRRRDRRHRRDPAGRPDDVRADPQHPHARHVPDRVAGAAGAGRQVRAADVRGHHHRHLAVPARAGEERHGHPVPHGPERLAGRRSTRTPTSSSPSRRPPGWSSSTSRCCRSSPG